LSFQQVQECCFIFCNFIFFLFHVVFWPGQLLMQYLVNGMDYRNLDSADSSHDPQITFQVFTNYTTHFVHLPQVSVHCHFC
jgi:hypothetical protein